MLKKNLLNDRVLIMCQVPCIQMCLRVPTRKSYSLSQWERKARVKNLFKIRLIPKKEMRQYWEVGHPDSYPKPVNNQQ